VDLLVCLTQLCRGLKLAAPYGLEFEFLSTVQSLITPTSTTEEFSAACASAAIEWDII